MKKLLGTTLALAMFVPAGANAELLKNFKVGGQLDIQTTSARNVTDFVTRPNHAAGGSGPGAAAVNNDRIGTATTRVILKLDWDLLDDVHSRVTLVKGAWNNAARTYGAASQSLTAIEGAVFVEEANVKIDKVFGAFDVTAGRQFYGEEGDLVIYFGPRDNYGLSISALDIFRADWNGEHMAVTGVAGKIADVVAVGTTGGAATDLRGVTVSCKMHELVKPSLYVYNRVMHRVGAAGSAAGKNDNLWVAGVKAKIATGGLSASVELAKNFGENRAGIGAGLPNENDLSFANYKGYAIQAKAGYKLDLSNVGTVNPWGEFGLGTGDSNFNSYGNNTFTAIATDYRPGGIYGRFDVGTPAAIAGGAGLAAFTPATVASSGGAGSNGLSNRIIWGFGVKATPTAVNKLTAGLAFYRYAFHRVVPSNNGSKTSRNIGSEVDVTGEWKHSENVSFKATAGTFQPGAYIKDLKGANAAVNPAVMLAGDVSIKF